MIACRALRAAALIGTMAISAGVAAAAELRVLRTGLGSGTVTSSVPGISCGTDCSENYPSTSTVGLTATAAAGSTFVGWDGDCTGATCSVSMAAVRSVRARFAPSAPIPALTSFTPEGIAAYLTDNPQVNSPAKFLQALPLEYKQNWILMPRSESLQTGTAEFPRILLPNADATSVFTIGLAVHGSYPGSHPNVIEYMQWDPTERNFRFHEIVLTNVAAMGTVPERFPGVAVDEARCTRCHSTRNVLNRTVPPSWGTTGFPAGVVKAKNKPNWDTYDSWGGMLGFNRDRIYQGSVEAAAFRQLLNLWTWSDDAESRAIIEQLELQPPGVPPAHVITRTVGGANDGHINFAFDASPPVLTEPAPVGSAATISTAYNFESGSAGAATSVVRGGNYVTLHHQNIPISDEGRGVRFFDALGGIAGNLNGFRVVDEIIDHRWATGSWPIDVRPIALAITKGCLSINAATNQVTATAGLSVDLSFFNTRSGLTINELVTDTDRRAKSIPKRKADIEKINLDRSVDVYLDDSDTENGLILEFGPKTSQGTDAALPRLRQEVFRRPNDIGVPDATVMGGIYVDRELYSYNTHRVALFRYFLEPLGVSVDKWSMGVRGRSRSYTFADVLSAYVNIFQAELQASLTSRPVPGLASPFECASLIAAVNTTLGSLPAVSEAPKYTDIQRILNKSCIECHGGLDYPPFANYGGPSFDFSEDEEPPAGDTRLKRSYDLATALVTTNPDTSFLYRRITDSGALTHPYDPTTADEACPNGLMPCGGPPLNKTDILTIRRWIQGGAPLTYGDPHLKTVNGVNYDFQAAGEFVLLRDEGFELQARHSAVSTQGPLGPNGHTGLTSCVSLNTAVAMKVGKHRVTYQPALGGKPNPEGLELRVDGKLVQLGRGGFVLPAGGRIIRTPAQGGIQIEAEGGASVTITPGWWSHYEVWYLNIDTKGVRATDGLMGSIARGQWLPALPDGTFLGPRPGPLEERYSVLYEKFGNAWRVSDQASLFDYAPNTSTETFTIPSWPQGESPQRCTVPRDPDAPPGKPALPPLTQEAAQQACAALQAQDMRANCVLDVAVTGEASIAKTYLAAGQVAANVPPTVPELVSPSDLKVGMVVPLVFEWKAATDPDGDSLRYQYCVWEKGSSPSFNDCRLLPEEEANFAETVHWVPLLLLVLLVIVFVVFAHAKIGWPTTLALAIIALLLGFLLLRRAPPVLERRSVRVDQLTTKQPSTGKRYLWKVIVEDGRGGTVHSETRRLELE